LTKSLSLLFAIVTTLFMIGIAVSLSYRSPLLVALFVIAAVVNTGAGFIVKARMNRKQDGNQQP